MVADWYDALLPPLPANLYLLRQKIDVSAVDSPQLGQSHSRRVKQLENRVVAHVGKAALLRFQLGALKEQVDLRPVEIAGQVAVELRAAHPAGGVGFDVLVSMHVGIKASNRRESARDGALRQPAPGEV